MRAVQFTVAFTEAVGIRELAEILARHYGKENVEIGQGLITSGIPHDWIVIANDRPRRMD